jgi:hypothetical protein
VKWEEGSGEQEIRNSEGMKNLKQKIIIVIIIGTHELIFPRFEIFQKHTDHRIVAMT